MLWSLRKRLMARISLCFCPFLVVDAGSCGAFLFQMGCYLLPRGHQERIEVMADI